MSQDVQSIEDLINSSKGKAEDETAQSKLASKQAEIEKKNIEKEAEIESAVYGLPYFSLVGFPISPEAITLINEPEAERLETVCFYYDGSKLNIATNQPENQEIADLFEHLLDQYHCEGNLYYVSKNSIKHALDFYRTLPQKRTISRGINITEEDLNKYSDNFSTFTDLQKQISNGQISDIIVIIMAAAVKSGTSDVHIEAEEEAIKIRFRLDGILHEVASLNSDFWKKIISRLKGLAKVKINISNRPQDGRISINTEHDRIDIRVSFLPTAYGESVVMRFLRSSSVGLSFEDLGIRARSFEQLKKEVERPNGMIITTGPTGSGKTTTLYAILKKLNDQETKIITVEDPIEYQLKGVNQSQTSENYTFAQAMRSLVRQDPDVIMVGEIRDLETAEVAIQAALTGHLVLSTIHTNDAAGTIPRFLSMGSKPYLLAPALNAMIGQRLVRRICMKCKKEVEVEPEMLARAKELLDQLPIEEKQSIDFGNLKFYKGEGCDNCQGIGFKGRVGIYEIMTMNAEIEKVILSGSVSEFEMRSVATKNGMVTMAQDGLLKALEGLTSLDEVFRVAE